MQKELERCYELTYMLDHWQIGDEVTLAGPLGEFVYLPVRDGKTVIVFPSARIASICGSNSLILVYFLDITKPPRVVLLSYTGRSFVYCLLFTDRFIFYRPIKSVQNKKSPPIRYCSCVCVTKEIPYFLSFSAVSALTSIRSITA